MVTCSGTKGQNKGYPGGNQVRGATKEASSLLPIERDERNLGIWPDSIQPQTNALTKRKLARGKARQVAASGAVGVFWQVRWCSGAGLRRIRRAENSVEFCPADSEQFRGPYLVSSNAF